VTERTPQEWLSAITPEGVDPVARLAITESHPTWIVKAMREALLGHGRSLRESVDADLAALLRRQ